MKILNISLLFSLLALASCATRGSNLSYPSQMDIEVKSAQQRSMDAETDRKSQILHSFLSGQLSYLHDDHSGAVEHFKKTDSLLDKPNSQVNAVLAELYLKERSLEKARIEIEKAIAGDTNNVQYRLLYAGILESLGELKDAEEQYLAVNKLQSDLPEPYLLLASLYGRQGQLDEGISILKRFTAIQPESRVGYELLGRFYEMKDQYDLAEKSYKKSEEIGGLSDELFASYIRIYLRQNKSKEAKAIAQVKLQQSPNHLLAQRILGELAIHEGSVDEGLNYLREAQSSLLKDAEPSALDGEASSDSEELRFRIALLELERQNYKAAERELLLLIAKNSEHGEAHYYLASIYAGSNRRDEALELLDNIDQSSKMFTKGKTFAAFLYRQEGKLEEAKDCLISVLEIEPENLKARSYLVLILRDNGNYEEALGHIDDGLKFFPSDERLLFQAAIILHDLGEEEQAIEKMEEVISVNENNSDALNFIAYSIAEKGGDLDRAESLVKRALKIRSEDGFYLDTLGWIQFLKKDYVEAEKTLEKAARISNDDVVVLEHYADALIANEKYSKAIEVLERAESAVSTLEGEERAKAKDRIATKLEILREK